MEFLVIVGTAFFLIVMYVIPLWRIATKMGYPGPLAILACLPIVNVMVAYIVAFADWPIEKEVRSLRRQR